MTESYTYKPLDQDGAALLRVDHQSGRVSLVVKGIGALFSEHIPNYRNLMTSYAARSS